jgi:hypothetical protein
MDNCIKHLICQVLYTFAQQYSVDSYTGISVVDSNPDKTVFNMGTLSMLSLSMWLITSSQVGKAILLVFIHPCLPCPSTGACMIKIHDSTVVQLPGSVAFFFFPEMQYLLEHMNDDRAWQLPHQFARF